MFFINGVIGCYVIVFHSNCFPAWLPASALDSPHKFVQIIRLSSPRHVLSFMALLVFQLSTHANYLNL